MKSDRIEMKLLVSKSRLRTCMDGDKITSVVDPNIKI